MRSMTAPDMIEAVVQANRVNAPQKTPDALSEMFGPIYCAASPQPSAMELAYSPPEMPAAPAEKSMPVGKPQYTHQPK